MVIERLKTVAADGTSIAFTEAGEGQTVLLVHGTGLSEVVWRGLGYTAALNGFHIIGVDLRGHGRSGKPHRSSDYTFETQASDLLCVMDEVGVETVHLVGYSLGACLGFHLAHQHPERISTFVSLGGRFGPLHGEADTIFFPDSARTLQERGMNGFLDAWEEHHEKPIDPSTALALRNNDPLALAALITSLNREPGIASEKLTAIHAPTVLITGEHDDPGRETAQIAASLMPNAQSITLPGLDHATLLNHPTTASLTAQFLKHYHPAPIPRL